jgi:acyl-CoA synthetase (AMP-forming)/AMP-acid ligase II
MPSVHAPVFPQYQTVPQMMAASVAAFGDRELLVCEAQRVTYREADEQSADLAAGLIELGVSKGIRVAVLVPSGAHFLISWLAVTRIGAVFVPLSTFSKPAELVSQLRSADIHTLIVRDRFLTHAYAESLASELPQLVDSPGGRVDVPSLPVLRNVIVDAVAGPCPSWAKRFTDVAAPVSERARVAELEHAVNAADDAIIIYTSGSTAAPKGVIHTQGTLVRHPVNVNARRTITQADRLYLALPLFWVGGFSQGLVGAYVAGACVVVDETFEAGRALAAIEKERVTLVSGWPFHGAALRNHPDYHTRELGNLRTDMRNHLTPPQAPVDVTAWSNWIGMTETFGAHLLAPQTERLPEHLIGSFGTPLPGLEHRVVDPESGAEVDRGAVGELLVRGYAVMKGYVGVEREQSFRPDGFYRTGDLGYFSPEGHFFLTGRISDVIKTSGSNVSTAEVAAVLQEQAGVTAAHVVGLPDEQRGEIVAAAVVADPGVELDLDALRAAAKQALSAFKVPRHLVVLAAADIPMTATGKLNRAALRAQITDLVGATSGGGHG